ncbi:hypothetical protein VaNZ11_006070 [Volvox africanus]|uniref:Uncharacterized protein n=1 Tax=Volvox africanus TaxID=51714 RepID=A0ABQ5S1A5_9CHLO|nr:hypothetical protein VaNZ11_006070 [Volvox africanus]
MASALALACRSVSVVAAIGAVFFTVLGYFGPKIVEDALHKGILENIVWRPDSPPAVHARFRGDPDPSGEPDYFRIWIWNITNLPDVRKGAKPKMAEVGPLTYVKSRVRLDPRWNAYGRVTVKEWDYHIFVPELSAASPDNEIVTLNLPLVGVLEILHSYSSTAVQPLLDVLVGVLSKWRDEHVDGLFTRRTAGELIWGYELSGRAACTYTYTCRLPGKTPSGEQTKRRIGSPYHGANLILRDLLLQRLSMLLGSTFVKSTRVQLLRNDSLEEVMARRGVDNVIDTGWRPTETPEVEVAVATMAGAEEAVAKLGYMYGGSSSDASASASPSRLGKMSQQSKFGYVYDTLRIWNMEMESGWREVTSWGPNCREPVRGTDAFQFRPSLDRNSVLRVWIAELFRSAELIHVADEELYGIGLLRFIPDPREAEPDPCHHQFIRGLANVTVPMAVGPNGNGSSEAAHGVPLLMSLPHYCLVDEAVSAALEGIFCDPAHHGIFLDVEPITGITMRAAKRLQLSSQLTTSARGTLEPSIGTSLILPIFWAEEASKISGIQAASFRSSVYHAQHILMAVRTWSYPATAAAIVLAVLALLVVGRLHAQQPQPPQRQASLSGGYSNGGNADDTSGGSTVRDTMPPLAPALPLPISAPVLASPSYMAGMQAVAMARAAADSADGMSLLLDVHEDGEGAGGRSKQSTL